jgi:hypothetical protein
MIGARIGARIGAVIGAQIGVGADELGGAAPSMSGVTKDATSGIYVPQNASEWASALAVAGIASGGPLSHWSCQDASGNLVDNIGGLTLTVAGTPGYQQAVTGWTRTAFRLTDAATMSASSTSASLPNIATTSALLLAVIVNRATPAATRNALTLGTTIAAIGPNATGPTMRCLSNANTASGANNLPATAILVALRVNRTASSQSGFTLQDKITPTFSTGITGQKVTLGPSSGTLNAPPWDFLDVTLFSGAAAEWTDAQLRSMYSTLGWTETW